MPTYDTEPRHLREAIGSVHRAELSRTGSSHRRRRLDPRGHPPGAARAGLPGRADHAARMLDRNSGISGRDERRALSVSRGELVAFLDHDDVLTPDALCAGRAGLRARRRRRRLLRPGQAHAASGRAHGSLPEAGLVAGLRPGRDVRRTPARRSPLAARSSAAASTPHSTRSRTSSCSCGSPSEPSGSTTSRGSSTTGGRSRAASPRTQNEKPGVRELQARAVNDAPAPPAGSPPRPRRTR